MRLKVAAAALLLVVGGVACAKESTVRTSAEEATKIDVTAKDYGFTGVPAEIEGGRIDLTFRNEGEVEHEFAVVELNGKTPKDFAGVAAKFMEGGPIPDWMTNLSAPGHAKPGVTQTTSFDLPEGDYYVFCALSEAPGGKEGKPHFLQGMEGELEVDGDNGAEIDAADGQWIAEDYTFVAPEDLQAGKNTFEFRNNSPEQWHFMNLTVYPDGVEAAEAEKAFGTLLTLEEGQQPPAGTPMGEEVIDTGIFGPKLGQTFDVELEAGRTYLAACFIQDRTGGPPHAIGHKMYKAFTVEG